MRKCHECEGALEDGDAVLIEGITIMNGNSVSLDASDVELTEVRHHECDTRGGGDRIKQEKGGNRMEEDRYMEMVLSKGLHEFWAVVSKAYPLIKSGDLSPGIDRKMEDAVREALSEWIRGNTL